MHPQRLAKLVEGRLGAGRAVHAGEARQLVEVDARPSVEQPGVAGRSAPGPLRDGLAGDGAERERLGRRVPPAAVGPVDAGHRLADGGQPGDGRLADRVDDDAPVP